MTLGTFVFVLKNLLLNIQPQYDCFGISKSLEDLCDFTCEPIEVLLVIAKLEKLGFQRMLNAPLQVHNDIFACPCIHNQLLVDMKTTIDNGQIGFTLLAL